MCALGYFIGPTAGGMLVDMFGFRWASLFVIGGQLILVIMLSKQSNFLSGIYVLENERKWFLFFRRYLCSLHILFHGIHVPVVGLFAVVSLTMRWQLPTCML